MQTDRHSWWRTLIPYVLTAAVAIAGSLLIQATLLRPSVPTITVPTAQPTLAASPLPQATAAPAGTAAPAPAAEIVRQEIEDLRYGQSQLWTAIYLSRALSQVSDAEATLRDNDLASVDQTLIAIDDSLALAYERADTPVKDPIEQLRRRTDEIREDLFLRPEGMDRRLAELRGLILALIEARQ